MVREPLAARDKGYMSEAARWLALARGSVRSVLSIVVQIANDHPLEWLLAFGSGEYISLAACLFPYPIVHELVIG
jgi:hypothetical protein